MPERPGPLNRPGRSPKEPRLISSQGGHPTLVTAFGVTSLSFMMLMYALEHRGRGFIFAFAVGCALSSIYGFLSGAWPFGVIEAIWAGLAVRKFATTR